MYHKTYDEGEPVTAYIYHDRMEITSVPGPDGTITDEGLKIGQLISKRYRNRHIGEFLKDLGLAEGRNTGVPLMIDSMERNGLEAPVFETDSGRSHMTVVLPINPHFLPAEGVKAGTRTKRRNPEEMASDIIKLLEEYGEMSIREIPDALGYSMPLSSLRSVIGIVVASKAIEYTQPSSMRSPTQAMRLRRRE